VEGITMIGKRFAAALVAAGLAAWATPARAGDTIRLDLADDDAPVRTLVDDGTGADTIAVGRGGGGFRAGSFGGFRGGGIRVGSFGGFRGGGIRVGSFGGFRGGGFRVANFGGFRGGGFRVANFGGFRGARFAGFRVANIGGFRGARFVGFRGARFVGFRGWGFRPFWGGFRPFWGWGYGYYPGWWYGLGYPYYGSYYSYPPAYYYGAPYYSDDCSLGGATIMTPPMTGAPATVLDESVIQTPSPMPLPPDSTFPYDGGPKTPVPMPRAEPAPATAPPATGPAPAEGRVVALPTRATKWAYPAYGEQPGRTSFAQDQDNTRLTRQQPAKPAGR
jgi:hypothetical protein